MEAGAWLSIDEVATMLGMAPDEVAALFEDGLPFAELPGGQIRVEEADLVEYLGSKKRAVPGSSEPPPDPTFLYTSSRVLPRPPVLAAQSDGGPFEFRWPNGSVESYPRSTELTALVGGRHIKLRHAIGTREAFGRPRVRSVTFVERRPMVEGVEADDYRGSKSLISRLTRGGSNKLVAAGDPLYLDYASFLVVDHSSEIRAPFSPNRLAVKIVEDDLTSWVTHALIRARQKKWRI